MIHEGTSTTKTGTSKLMPVDATACQTNNQLHKLAPTDARIYA